jgi:hypothetical protein
MPEQMRLADRNAVMAQLKDLGEEDLIFLNKLIVGRLKLIAQARSTSLMARFNVGDRVEFRGPAGDRKIGTIVRINKKTASVLTDGRESWNVFPGFLSPESVA